MSDKDSIVVPGWAKASLGFCVAVIVGVVSTISWLDSHYATKHELKLVAKDVSALQKIEQKLDNLDEKVGNLRVLLAALGKESSP